MLKTRIIAGMALLGLFAAAPAMADHPRNAFDVRQDRQDARIEQGVRSGELTRHETRMLRREARELERLERALRDDGRLSKRDRRLLQREYDELSRRIYALKHNDRYRGRADRRDRWYGDRWAYEPQRCR